MTARTNHAREQKLPLTNKDRDALDEIFAKLELEDIQQIETTATRYAFASVEPLEEKGWVINSFIPQRQ